jgi:hypothetical protein
MRKTTFSADRLSDPEITTCILRRPAPRSCSSSSTWWSSAAAIAAGVVLLVLTAAAAGCDEDKPYEATCEEQAQQAIDCDGYDEESFDFLVEQCENAAGLETYDCYSKCDVDLSCDDYDCCQAKCANQEC